MQREIHVQCKEYVQDVAMPLVSGDYNSYVIVMPISEADSVTGFLIEAKKPNGVTIVDSGTVIDNVCRYTIKTNIYDIPGDVIVRVAPISSDTKLTVCELRFTAVAALSGTSEVPSDKIPALTSAIAHAHDMGDYAAAQGAKIENLGLPDSLDEKADKTSPIINNKLIVQTGESDGATPTVPYVSIYPISGGAAIKFNRYAHDAVMTPTFKITESGLIYNQDGDDYKVYAENNKPPMDAAMINVQASAAVFDCSKTRIIKVKSVSAPPSVTIQNAYPGCRGAVYVPDGAPYILLPSGSKKAANRFDDDSTGGPLLYEFFYDGTTYWWTCTKYNNA